MSHAAVSDPHNGLEIAIIGMAGRFPGARDIEELWRNVRDGVESITSFTDAELTSSGVPPTMFSDPNYVKARGVLEDAEWFDASFFGFPPREAELMDPQHRLFLECAWQALEHAGYATEAYQGSIGVYAGTGMNTYLWHNLYPNRDRLGFAAGLQMKIAGEKDHLTTRVSHKLNFRGPSVVIQTSSSTSLVAVHLACQSLLSGECDVALAGGVSLEVPQTAGYMYQEGGIYSPDGHSRTFDAKAQGTVFSNGVGIVVLKRLQDALADEDCIQAVIKGSAINNDGSLKVGYTAPNVEGQARVITRALAMADIDPATVSYIEAHGTATTLGDPIEIAALTRAFRAHTKKQGFCAIGSVKTNFGHLGAAAGVTGLIKTVLALKNKMIPPSLHFEQPNPQIDFANSLFYVNTTLADWPAGQHPRRAGVSAFGLGGTNAHVVLEEAPPAGVSERSKPWQLLVLSAKTPSALETATANLAEDFKRHPDLNLADVAYTLHVGRRAFSHRRTMICSNVAGAVTTLEMLDPKRVFTSIEEPHDRPVAFMFPGGGAQYVNMGHELYQTEPTFREQVDMCVEILKPILGLDLRNFLYPTEGLTSDASQKIRETSIALPLLFVIEYALARLWISWGVHPQALIGHSLGEYVAACLAGVLSLGDALSLVALRGRLFEQLPKGAMINVPLPERELQSLLGTNLSLAATNGPSLCTVSGPTDAIEALEKLLMQKELEFHRLQIDVAAHSHMVTPILEEFTKCVEELHLQAPSIPYVSNVSGTWMTAADAMSPSYWARHLRQTVRFTEGLEDLLKESDRVLLEVGPGRTLTTFVRQHPGKIPGQMVFSSLRHPQDQQSDVAFLLTTLSQLWLAGIPLDWSGFYASERRKRLPLPTYPFERERYWVEPQEQDYDLKIPQRFLRKESDIANWFYIPSWKRSVLPEFLDQRKLTTQKSCWLVFIDACGLGSKMIDRLKRKDQDVITVMAGEQFSRVNHDIYTINPRHQDDYDALLKELLALQKIPNMVVHLWNVTANDQIQSGIDAFEKFQYIGFYSLIFLLQALGKQNILDALRIEVVSTNIHDVTGEEFLCPEKATVLGPCKVLPKEVSNVSCVSVDIIMPQSGSPQEEKLIDQLIAEIVVEPSDSVIAYRGHHRWVQTFEPVHVNGAVGGTPRLREGGVYLITGGLGGIGLALAEYLAQTVRAKLILIGRSAIPGREDWERWLSLHDAQDAISCKIVKIQALEELGAEVLVLSADVANEEQMQDVINRTHDRFGAIHGVIHAAGIAGGGMIQMKTPEIAASVLAPKVKGTRVLEAIFKGVKLDFWVLCSSIASIEGGLGQVDYSAANAFLDAFAHYTTDRVGTFTVAVNWPAWKEVGMAVNTAVPVDLQEWREEALSRGISSTEGVEVFLRVLSRALSQVVISPQDLQSRLEQNSHRTAANLLQKLEQARLPKSTDPQPQLGKTYIYSGNDLEQAIADVWREVLGIDQVGTHDSFFNLGGSSLTALQVLSRLRRAFHVELPLRTLFDEGSTVADLALAVAQKQGEQKDRDVNIPKRSDQGDAEQLLAKLDHLPDEEVDSLLSEMLTEEGLNE